MKTTEQKLSEITNDIREKLPRLKELSEGCILISKSVEIEVKINCINTNNIYLEYKDQWYNKNMVDGFKKEYIKRGFKIIGHEPQLNDVLEWLIILNLSDRRVKIGFENDQFYKILYYSDGDIRDTISETWDLSKPYLKDQSPELIDFLYNLLSQE